VAEGLQRKGLIGSRKKRGRVPAHNEPVLAGNDSPPVWGADGKGWFPTGDGPRGDPLTITDAWSRFVFRCQMVAKTN
jgi:hypothetical protein